MHIETLAVHAGHHPDPTTGAVNPPIYLSTTFAREADGTLPHGFMDARSDNPTRNELGVLARRARGWGDGDRLLVRDGGDRGGVSVHAPGRARRRAAGRHDGSGQAAARSDGGLGTGQEASVDMTERPRCGGRGPRRYTRLIWIETPSNPALAVTDIARVSAIALARPARVASATTPGPRRCCSVPWRSAATW